MVKTFKRICTEETTLVDEDRRLTLERGKEYITSREREDGTVKVFSTYWADVPVSIFAGGI